MTDRYLGHSLAILVKSLILLNEWGKVIGMLPHEAHDATPEGQMVAYFTLAHIKILQLAAAPVIDLSAMLDHRVQQTWSGRQGTCN